MNDSYCDDCREGWGWMCERHHDKPVNHDGCKCPGMPCPSCFGNDGYPGIPDGAIILACAELDEKPDWDQELVTVAPPKSQAGCAQLGGCS